MDGQGYNHTKFGSPCKPAMEIMSKGRSCAGLAS